MGERQKIQLFGRLVLIYLNRRAIRWRLETQLPSAYRREGLCLRDKLGVVCRKADEHSLEPTFEKKAAEKKYEVKFCRNVREGEEGL